MHLEFKKTSRGFARLDFKDFNGEECSLQKSSIVATTASDEEVEAVWLGCNKNTTPHLGHELAPRMHLTRAQVATLLPFLQQFVMTGEFHIEPREPITAVNA